MGLIKEFREAVRDFVLAPLDMFTFFFEPKFRCPKCYRLIGKWTYKCPRCKCKLDWREI